MANPRGNPAWKKGVSGNAGGRVKNEFAELIRHSTKNGKELAEKALELMRNSKDEAIIMKAIDWLADRGFGKPVQEINGTLGIADLLNSARKKYEN